MVCFPFLYFYDLMRWATVLFNLFILFNSQVMAFTNTQVDPASLPAAEDIRLQPVQPAYLRVLRIEWIITSIVLAAITAALIFFVPSMRQTYGWSILLGALLLIISAYRFIQERAFPFLAFAIREKDVAFQSGWIFRSLKICPFNRIQNCSVQAGPLERRFHLSSIVVYTAGSNGADLKIPGLSKDEAEQLRQFILAQIHTGGDEAL